MTIVVVVAVLLALVVGAALAPGLHRQREWRRHVTTLARQHGLDAAATQLLWSLAWRLAPHLPVLVFVQPSLLQRGIAELGADARAVGAIATRLYAP